MDSIKKVIYCSYKEVLFSWPKKGSKFTKYSPEFKLQVVDYLSAKSGGMPSIVKKYGLKSDNQVLTWTRKIKRYDSLRI